MKSLFTYIFAFILLINGYCWPAIINIPPDFPTIQQGIDASANGDTVLVQPGTYTEPISIVDKNIVLASNYLLSADTLDIVNTIINGDSLDPPVIAVQNSADTACITGFTIKNCLTSNPTEYAVTLLNAKLEYNFIENNRVQVIWASYSDILNNTLRSNDSSQVVIDVGTQVNISDNIFQYNVYSLLMFISGNSVIENNIIHDNEAAVTWYWMANQGIFRKNIIYNNVNPFGPWFGAIFHSEDTFIYADNNIIYDNDLNDNLGYLFDEHWSGTQSFFSNNIIWNNLYQGESIFKTEYVTLYVTYSDVQGGWPGEGNIECDPQFCDPDSGNFYLHYNSCCVGSGQNGENMGIYGVGCWSPCDTYVVGDVNGSGVYDGLDVMYGVSFLKGGPAPTLQCECAVDNILYPAGDVNNSCSYNGLDITYSVAYFKGGSAPAPCQDCPPVR